MAFYSVRKGTLAAAVACLAGLAPAQQQGGNQPGTKWTEDQLRQTVDLAQRLRAQNVPFEQLILPDEIHGFLMWEDWVRAYAATADFFDRTLKRGEQIGTGN